MNEKESITRRLRRLGRRTRPKVRRWLRRGLGYQLYRVFFAAVIIFYFAIGIYLFYGYVFNTGAIYKLQWDAIISIVIADIPVGLVLWVVLQRRESKNRRLLDSVEMIRARAEFSHLEVHYCDPWNTAEYPYQHYYIINAETKLAFWVSDEVQDLVEEQVIRTVHPYRDLDELTRYFVSNGIEIQPRYPEGRELSREV